LYTKAENFSILFLGTGTSSGVPMVGCSCTICTSTNPKDNRLRSSILIETATTTVVVDTTPDFRYQMLRANIKKVDAIVYTHPHKDHVAGLDDVRGFNFISQKEMPLYANALTEQRLHLDFDYAFASEKPEGLPLIHIVPIATDPFMIGDIPFIPIQVWHHKMLVLGFRIGDFAYITDANKIDAEEMDKLRGVKILVLNALRKEPHLSHFTLSEAIAVAQDLKVEHAYFTHISHQLGLHDAITQELPHNMHLAYDGLRLKF
jgi:phosphoribosyl 1,2-cyclic phosphate phosphodiesterase